MQFPVFDAENNTGDCKVVMGMSFVSFRSIETSNAVRRALHEENKINTLERAPLPGS